MSKKVRGKGLGYQVGKDPKRYVYPIFFRPELREALLTESLKAGMCFSTYIRFLAIHSEKRTQFQEPKVSLEVRPDLAVADSTLRSSLADPIG